MRLWHKDLIPVLPRQQLLGQWRECCLIAKNIAENGTPNHILVNKILNYHISHFFKYGWYIKNEMERRNYKCDFNKFTQYFRKEDVAIMPTHSELFYDWHNERYLIQCFYNLQEKHDCGGISDDEWHILVDYVQDKTFRI